MPNYMRPTSARSARDAAQQGLDVRVAAPAYGFGAATRDTVNKLFISQEHTLIATGGSHSPGPVYTLPPSVGGNQPDGRKRDAPSFGFGTASRFRRDGPRYREPAVPAPNAYNVTTSIGGKQPDARKIDAPVWTFGGAKREKARKIFVSQAHQKTDFHGVDSPGPGRYDVPTTLGKQADGAISSPPAWLFGSAVRTIMEPGWSSPGPIYGRVDGLGTQVDSRRRSAATPGFGASTRDGCAKVFISGRHGKNLYGRGSPGPAASYQLDGALGKQVASTKGQSPRAAFSKESRFRRHEKELRSNTVPGPGAY